MLTQGSVLRTIHVNLIFIYRSMSRTRPVKRKHEDLESQFRSLAKRKKMSGPVQPLRPITKNPIAQQTIRVGGWANPSGGGELKYRDDAANFFPVTANSTFTGAGAPVLLNGIATGAGATERIGRKIILKSLLLRWRFDMNPAEIANITGGVNGRLVVVYDKQANAVAPNITDVFNTDNFISQLNLNNRDRFVVLVDKITDPISKEGDWSTCGKRFVRLNNEVVFNQGTTNDIGSIQTGSVYAFFAVSGGLSFTTANCLRFACSTRIRYSDM